MKKTYNIILKILLIVIAVVIIISFILLNKKTIYTNVSINGIDVGELDKRQAIELLKKELFVKLKENSIILKYNNEELFQLDYNSIGLDYDYSSAVESAFKIGREGTIFNRLKEIIMCKINGRNIDMKYIWDEKILENKLLLIENNINTASKNASIQCIDNKIQITKETVGKKLNKELLRTRIIQAINNNYSTIVLPVEEDIPPITYDFLSSINGEISSFSTSFKGSSKGRINNIKLAASAINGILIMPQEEISFNDITGPRSKKNGYQESSVIVAGDYTTGIGGGVCQVSTTLYNALLLADVNILERHPHSIPASYVSYGRDAAVSDNYLDLKFKNDKDTPIYICAGVQGYDLIIKVFGNKEDGKEVQITTTIVEKISPEVEEVLDESLKPGEKIVVQKGRYGYKVKTYKIVYEQNIEKEKRLVSFDYYKPRKKLIKIGPEKLDVINEEHKD